LIESIMAYEESRPIEQSDLMKRITNAHGKELSKEDVARFIRETAVKDHLITIEPHSFIENYNRLIS
jgi:hypothetical protein